MPVCWMALKSPVLENPVIVEAYLKDQDRLWRELEQKYPMPPDMLKRYQDGMAASGQEQPLT